ncbi:MAG: DNA repair protein RecO [Bacillota bacterium]
MKFLKAEAVVLKASEYKEADRILTLYSLEYGKIRAISYGSARPTSKKRGAVQPFSRSRFFLTREKDLSRVDQAEELEHFQHIEKDVRRFGLAHYFAELVDGFTVEGVPNQPLYLLLVESLRMLNGDSELLTRAFEIRVLALTGFGPELNCCVSCRKPLDFQELMAFSPEAGGVLCPVCRQGVTAAGMLPGTLKTLRRLSEDSLGRVFTLKPDPAIRTELNGILPATIAFHFGYRPRSLRFLDDLQ